MPKKILVVDDEPDVRTYLVTLLGDAGYDTISAEDGVEGMKLVHEQSPDLITLDITMPEKSGVRMYTELKNDEKLKSIPVIVVTGIQGEIEKFLSTRRQVPPPEDFMAKPIDKDVLVEKVGKLVG
jgi:CheY-like chemotaxis protein